ncbi:hypothetical protein G9F73_008030 [Clostridium estertheticum]|uniref:hypothetical protein n=1 Tax=Clostridium estertheticum TaxID=238834 RepID=UPI0013EEB921|nr:hypothetical protein [Clostridium estertheticum]MBZ9607760.1 hypothetical protein [Clostridium estertheticum]
MKKLEEFTPSELAILATIIGIIIASKFNVNQQNALGNFLTGLAQSILIIAAQTQNLESQDGNQSGDNGNSNSKNSNSKNSNKDLQKQIDELKEYIKKFEDNTN